MKKLLVIFLALVLVFSVAGCSAKKEEEPQIVGGWTEKDEEITDELQEIFDKATEGLTGVGYKPLKLVGTQVVAGTNYKFLCEATTVTYPPTVSQKYVTVYKDLEGNCSVTDISDADAPVDAPAEAPIAPEGEPAPEAPAGEPAPEAPTVGNAAPEAPAGNIVGDGKAEETTPEGYILPEKAKSIALKHAGLNESRITDYKCELDNENGVMVYEVEFDADGYEYDYEIDAVAGEILKYEKEVDD